MRVKEGRYVRLEFRNGLVGRELDLRLPALDSDAPVPGVYACNDALCADGSSKFRGKCGVHFAFLRKKSRAQNHALRTSLKHLARAVDSMNAAAGLNGQAFCNLRDEC